MAVIAPYGTSSSLVAARPPATPLVVPISPPKIKAERGKANGRHNKHADEFFFLTLLMLGPVVASLPPVTVTHLVKGTLWAFLTIFVIVFVLAVLFLAYLILSWPKPRKAPSMRALAFQPQLVPNHLDTIVIGSGSGGSTCSNLLAQSGQRVLVLEQHPTVTGGCTHSFREQNCKC